MERVYAVRIPGYAKQPHAALESRTALRWAERLPAALPILLLNGDAGDRVDVADSRGVAARLAQLGRPLKRVVYAGETHTLQHNRMPSHQDVLAWFEQHKRPNVAVASAVKQE